ncbi:MAG: phosphatase PAP2 family protein [Firmicutes bacterium]|nr:phosphatase PAP2 family protein [Bacillota bacterium]
MANNLNKKCSVMWPIIFGVIFVIYTAVVKLVDIKHIGPLNSGVGLGTINRYFMNLIGINMVWYHITNVLGIVALLIVAFFAFVGLFQLVKRKSLKRVETDIIILGCFYVVVMIFYVLFDKFAINYRPVVFDEGLEPSYPSSHTFLAVCVFYTAILQIKWKVSDKFTSNIITVVLAVLIALTVVGRLLSGVHWFTDIVGGVLISLFLISLYVYFVDRFGRYKRRPACISISSIRHGLNEKIKK